MAMQMADPENPTYALAYARLHLESAIVAMTDLGAPFYYDVGRARREIERALALLGSVPEREEAA